MPETSPNPDDDIALRTVASGRWTTLAAPKAPARTGPGRPRRVGLGLLTAFAVVGVAAADPDGLTIPKARYPALPATAANAGAFAPAGWAVEAQATGDINGDGRPDLVFVLHQTLKSNILANPDGFGERTLDTNPRLLAVALGQGPGQPYRLAVQNHSLIPRHVEPTLDDAFENDGLAIKRGAFVVTLNFFASMGAWETSGRLLTFRMQGDRCVLIGFDEDSTQRNTGEETITSVNYLTHRGTVHRESMEAPATHDRKLVLRPGPPLSIDEVGDGLEFQPKP